MKKSNLSPLPARFKQTRASPALKLVRVGPPKSCFTEAVGTVTYSTVNQRWHWTLSRARTDELISGVRFISGVERTKAAAKRALLEANKHFGWFKVQRS